MKKSKLLLFLLLISMSGLFAQYTSTFNPTTIDVNAMSITSFDPNDPESQPLLTKLVVDYTGAEPKPRMDIKVRVVWNNQKLGEADFQSRSDVSPDVLYPVTFTSQQLISNDGHPSFAKKPGSPEISFDEIVDSPIFGDAVLSGYFPDGKLEFWVWIRQYSTAPWTAPTNPDAKKFTINIRNTGVITLLSPGAQIGQNPPQVSIEPVSYLWNSVETGFNTFGLKIKEFAESNPPTVNNVASTGNVICEVTGVQSGEAPNIPYKVGNYYAWQVSTSIKNEFNFGRSPAREAFVKSNWFVFKFVNESDASSGISELQAQLNLLNNNELRNVYNAGFNPLGTVIFEGRTYSGQDAIDLVESLVGKEIQVKLKD